MTPKGSPRNAQETPSLRAVRPGDQQVWHFPASTESKKPSSPQILAVAEGDDAEPMKSSTGTRRGTKVVIPLSIVDDVPPSVLCKLLQSNAPVNPSETSEPPPRIPRPPNAFMLYRSHILKEGWIPLNIEKRQQNLSRLAGQCWRLLPAHEKEYWKSQAAQALQEHKRKNPDYKFRPAPRGSRRAKANKSQDEKEIEAHINSIRIAYTPLNGAVAPPRRPRKPKSTKNEHRCCHQLDSPSRIPKPDITYTSSDIDNPPLPPMFPSVPYGIIASPQRPSSPLVFPVDLGSEASYTSPFKHRSIVSYPLHIGLSDIFPFGCLEGASLPFGRRHFNPLSPLSLSFTRPLPVSGSSLPPSDSSPSRVSIDSLLPEVPVDNNDPLCSETTALDSPLGASSLSSWAFTSTVNVP